MQFLGLLQLSFLPPLDSEYLHIYSNPSQLRSHIKKGFVMTISAHVQYKHTMQTKLKFIQTSSIGEHYSTIKGY